MTKKCPIAFAKSYPFDIPETSYALDKNGCSPLSLGKYETHDRHAVIASGSNASPQQLARKYQDHGHLLDNPIYVTRATLHDFDAVYSAHFSRYGSIPATLAYAPGVESRVFVTWLTNDQLGRMHETEAVGVNYDYTRLHDISLTLENGDTLNTAHAYLSRWGCLNHNDHPVPLAELPNQSRTRTPMNQCEVLEYARSLIAPHEDPETFIEASINSPALRHKRTKALAQTALPHGWEKLIFLS